MAHPKQNEYSKRYRERHHDEILVRERQYYKNNKEKRLEIRHRSYMKHEGTARKEFREKRAVLLTFESEEKEQAKIKRTQNASPIGRYYYLNRRDHNLARIKNNSRKLRENLLTFLGGKCAKCGTTENIEFDHINSNGSAEWKYRFGDTRKMWRYYRDHPDESKKELQVLCHFHNKEKQRLNKENGIKHELGGYFKFHSFE